MNTITIAGLSFSSITVERLGWVLVHSLWQFLAVGVFAAVIVRLMSRRSAAARYSVLVSAMTIMVAMPLGTWQWLAADFVPLTDSFEHSRAMETASAAEGNSRLASSAASPKATQASTATDDAHVVSATLASMRGDLSARRTLEAAVHPWLGWIVAAWGFGVFVCVLRPLLGWRTLRRFRRTCVLPVSSEIIDLLAGVSKRLGIRRTVCVMESTLAGVPMLIGYLRPVILLPASLLSNIPVAELETILAHELAHVRRHDFVVNLMQAVIETFCFYHPAAWWLSRQIRIEREYCCDDLVVATLNDRVTYSRALVTVAEFSGTSPALALSATSGSLPARVRRILKSGAAQDATASKAGMRWVASACVTVALGCGLLLTLTTTPVEAEPAQVPPVPADAADSTESEPTDAPASSEWGEATNGLRARLVPVLASMSEEAIDPQQRVKRFISKDDVAFVFEVENVTDKPLKLIDLRYGPSYGDSSGKPNSDWSGQFLFAVDEFDSEGNLIAVPEFEIIDSGLSMSGYASAMIDPGKRHRFLLRPTRWLSGFQYRPKPGRHSVAVRYHGLSRRASEGLRNSGKERLVGAVAGEVATPRVAFEIAPDEIDPPKPVWGKPINGLRAATALAPNTSRHVYGTKPKVELHIQNVSEKPIAFSAGLTQGEAPVTVTDKAGATLKVESVFYSGWTLTSHVVLQPRQTVTFHCGNIGVAATKEQADAFEHVTQRKLIAAEGRHFMQMSARIGGFQLKDGEGNVLAPLEGDWTGTLGTGATPLIVAAPQTVADFENFEPFDCVVVDAENDKPIADKELTIHFRFRRAGPREEQPETIASLLWGPESPSDFMFIIPEKVLEHPDRNELVVDWGVRHPDYEVFRAEKPVPLIDIIRDKPAAARDSFRRISLKRPVKPPEEDVPSDPFERRFSLQVKNVPLGKVLEKVADAAGLKFEPDNAALAATKIDLEKPVDLDVTNEPLSRVLNRLIAWPAYPGVFRELRGNRLVLTTTQASQARVKALLPDFLKPLYRKGLSVQLDADDRLEQIHVGSTATDKLLGQIAALSTVKKLELSSTENLTAEGLKYLSRMQQLESLQAFSLNPSGESLGDAVIASVVGLKSLRTLYIIECGTTDTGAELLEQMPQLTHLSLRQEGRLTDAALLSIGKLTMLKELRLASYVGTERFGFMRFSAAGVRNLAGLKSLEILELTGHETPPEVLDFPLLRSLSLGGMKVDDRCAERIAGMRHLRSLSLSFTGITDGGLKRISTLPDLRSLALNSAVITDNGVGHLTGLSKLVHLQVRCAGLSDASLAHISQVASLASLDLSGSGRSGAFSGRLFTGEGLSQLSALPKLRRLAINNLQGDNISAGLSKVTQLHNLNLMMVMMRSEELDILADAMPDATIHYMTGGSSAVRLPKRLRDQGVKLNVF